MGSLHHYDVIVVGAGHNGLIAACYLAQAGLDVLVLEKNDRIGGATRSDKPFRGVDARLSIYSYLVSLLPSRILSDLGIRLTLRRRAIASYTPAMRDGAYTGLLISNLSEEVTRQSFLEWTGSERDYNGYRELQRLLSLFAQKIWPTLTEPLLSRHDLRSRFTSPEERAIWEYLVDRPLADLIEDYLEDDLLRGAVFTDAKIGVSTFPEDPSLLQNRTFLYHTIGQGTGEWRVPVGGMGKLVEALEERLRGVEVQTGAEVTAVQVNARGCEVAYDRDGVRRERTARFVLFNTSSDIANRLLPGVYPEQQVEGSVFKINMVLRRLPTMKDRRVTAQEAFTGTLHFNEGYEHMKATYRQAQDGVMPDDLPGEIYCHSLTDASILSKELQAQGYHSLTLFGLDVPYAWFISDNEATREQVTRRYLRAINTWIEEDIHDLLALDADGNPCIEARSPLDLERSLGLPRGNIFHGNLSWPFAEREDEADTWGVETSFRGVYMCGSSARRGGAVSGIPGHNAAMKVLEELKK